MWDSKIPSWCQNDQRHIRARFGGILLKQGHPRTFTNAFSDRTPGGPIQGQVNGTWKQAYMHPRTTWTLERASDCPSELDLVSRVHLDLEERAPFQTGSSAQSSFGGKLTSEFHTPHSLQLLGLGKSFRLGPNKSVRFPEWHFSGRKRLSASLRGLLLTDGSHNGFQTPQGVRETLRKPRSRIPRSPPANDLRSRMAIQRFHTG
ncbi:hypothetical protein CRG98_012624 [Punica granatum]|uniref:Uncharacterized protein n=1 Tax=Punica granatum TaxID=22663 RepID=A0A2I0KEM1_PUNGR|nr:hypothetical protein CRG98_012624 [Punica granatum]